MRLLMLLALLATNANAEASVWKLFLVSESRSVHLQTHTELPVAGQPIYYDSKGGCKEARCRVV